MNMYLTPLQLVEDNQFRDKLTIEPDKIPLQGRLLNDLIAHGQTGSLKAYKQGDKFHFFDGRKVFHLIKYAHENNLWEGNFEEFQYKVEVVEDKEKVSDIIFSDHLKEGLSTYDVLMYVARS